LIQVLLPLNSLYIELLHRGIQSLDSPRQKNHFSGLEDLTKNIAIL